MSTTVSTTRGASPGASPGTTPGTTPVPATQPVARRIRAITPEQRFAQAGAWGAGLATSWILTQRLLPLGGPTWLLISWFALGLVFVALTTAMSGTASEMSDRIAAGVITGGALVVGAALLSTMVFVVSRGW